jgi:hypothetical protein
MKDKSVLNVYHPQLTLCYNNYNKNIIENIFLEYEEDVKKLKDFLGKDRLFESFPEMLMECGSSMSHEFKKEIERLYHMELLSGNDVAVLLKNHNYFFIGEFFTDAGFNVRTWVSSKWLWMEDIKILITDSSLLESINILLKDEPVTFNVVIVQE